MIKQILLVLISLLLISNSLFSRVLTVRDAIEQALKSSPELLELEKDIESTEKRLKYTVAPEKMQLYYFKEGFQNVTSDVFAEERFAVTQDIEFPGKTINKYKSIKQNINAQQENIEHSRLQLKSEVKQLYAKLSLYKAKVELREKQLSIADTMRNAAKFRFEAGYVSELDVLKSDIFYNEIYNELENARIELHTSRYDLFTKIGLDPEEQSYDITFPDKMVYVPLEINQKNVLSKLENYPLYRSYMNEKKSIEKLKSAEYSNLFPDLNLSYYIQDYGSGWDFQGFQVTFDVPIWFTLNESNRIQEKQIQIEKAEINQRKELLQLKLEIELAWHGYEESRKKIEKYNQLIREKSNRLRDLAMISYKEGELDLISLLNYESTYIDNELKYLEELENYYHNIFVLEKFLQTELLYK